MREEFAGDMLASLRAVLCIYGVQIMNVSDLFVTVNYKNDAWEHAGEFTV